MTMRNLLKIFEAEPATAPAGQAAMSYAGNQASSTPEPAAPEAGTTGSAQAKPEPAEPAQSAMNQASAAFTPPASSTPPPSSGNEALKGGIAAGSPAITGAAPASNMRNAADVMRGGQATKPEPAAPAATPAPTTPAPAPNALGVQAQANIPGASALTGGAAKPAATPAPQTNALGIAPQANIPGSPTATAPTAQQGAKPAAEPSTAVKGGFGQSTNLVTDTPDAIAKRGPFGAQQNQATKSYNSIGDFASAVGNKIKGAFGANNPPANAGSGAAAAMASKSAAPTATSEPAGGAAKPAATPSVQGSAAGYAPGAAAAPAKPGGFKATGMQSTDFEESLEEELNEILRLSGHQVHEKAPPSAKGERMVKHIKKGYAKDGKLTDKEKSIAYATAWKSHNKSKVTESIMLEAGSTLEHIIKKFKHETKNFLAGQDLDEDLYNALYDYYSDNGEMPYGVAKARDGDPFQWVGDRFADELQIQGYSRQIDMLSGNHELTELARLAGLSESQVAECGDMNMEQEDSMNVSTNMSSDGTKSVSISAQGSQADALLQMLKMAGMRPHDDHDEGHEEVVVIGAPEEEMMDEEYANSPEEEYETVDSIIHQGNDLNREKRQYADQPKLGDNPMAEDVALDEELQNLLDSILVREEMTDVLKAEQPYKDEKTGKMVTPPKGATNPPPDSQYPPGDKRNLKK